MTSFSHILSGAYIGVILANVKPTEINYILVAAASAGILDIDHLYYFIKDWHFYSKNGLVGSMHKARSMFHELTGFTIFAAIMFAVSFFNKKLAIVLGIPILIHITEDIITGRSAPLSPFNKTEITLLPQKMSFRIVLDILTILIFSFLWLLYLKGAN